MRDNDLQYGYRVIRDEYLPCIPYMNSNVTKYIRERKLQPRFFNKIRNQIFYNNFEISSVSFFRSYNYTDYFNYLDRSQGIFEFRWGDAPIKTYGLSLYGNVSKIHYFDVQYKHQNEVHKKQKYVKFADYLRHRR